MNYFRQINKWTLLLWSSLLLVWLCVQGTTLHVHLLDHSHSGHHDHSHAAGETSDHTHVAKLHFSHDASHHEHHENVISEVEISPEGVSKNLSAKLLTFALFAFIFTTLFFASRRTIVQRHWETSLLDLGRYIVSPPLRAPPL